MRSFIRYKSINKYSRGGIKAGEMEKEGGAKGGEEKYVQGFGGET